MKPEKNAEPPRILLVSTEPWRIKSFAEKLAMESRLQTINADSADKALDAIRAHKIVLAVVDDSMEAHSGLDLVRRLIRIDAFIHTAVLSDAGEEDFHNRSEGLGVLAKLPLSPTPEDALRLWKDFKNISSL